MTNERYIIQLGSGGLHYNGFRASAIEGNLMFQWGQADSTSDGAQSFSFQRAFASRCYALLTTCSRGDVRSAMPFTSRTASGFTLDRDSEIDGHYPFYWFAVGDAPGSAQADPRSATLGGDTTMLWGDAVSTSDGDQHFTTPVALGAGPSAALVTVAEANVRSALSITNFDGAGRKLSLNRHNDINGSIDFNYVAVGSRTGNQSTGVKQLGECKLQWGQGITDSDHEQLFELNQSFEDMDFAVFTTLAAGNFKQGLSLTRPVNPRSFIVDRDGSIDGARAFNWLAIGR
ncbi:hypothetical protein DB30_02819 [Enhygromyxa salina]|uniref:Putative tail fiber protein gp53-like C-terminal domain-containing protein n=1 Tax=Enhygromyxa salina TaxID=215803 RepID=A0A0C2D3J5_9BACT|nr:hypothetical protein [Enhygromyxa salina]KIG17786.1 hypothetical protein DB30_02819 [Enhygromyxa salina]